MCNVIKREAVNLEPGETGMGSVGQRFIARGASWYYINSDMNKAVTIQCEHQDGRVSSHVVRPGECLTDSDPDVILEIKKVERVQL